MERLKRKRDDNDKSGLYVIRQQGDFFLFNIQNNTHYIDQYDEDDDKSIIAELYYIYVINSPRTEIKINEFITLTENDKRACRMIHVIRHNGSSEYIAKSKQITYNTTCSMTDNLQRGDGTRNMFLSSMYVIYNVFGVDTISFTDSSHKNGTSVQEMCFALYATSWYEKHFGAEPAGEDEEDEWTLHKQNRATIMDTEKFREKARLLFSYEYKEHLDNFMSAKIKDGFMSLGDFFAKYKKYETTLNNDLKKKNKNAVGLFTKYFLTMFLGIINFNRVTNWSVSFSQVDSFTFENTLLFKSSIYKNY